MLRASYLATLVMLQIALAAVLAPSIGSDVARHVVDAASRVGPVAAVQFAGLLLAGFGLALALSFPLVALARHQKRGEFRFRGLPRGPVALALAGAVTFATGVGLECAAIVIDPEDADALAAARPIVLAGIALMTGGSLCAELLRRGVTPYPMPRPEWDASSARIEVVDPPELRTRMS